MKTEVLTIGPQPTLLLDGQRVVRANGRITLERYEGSGYPCSIEPQEMARHLLKYVRGAAGGFHKHAIDKDLRRQLEAVATGSESDEWISVAQALEITGLTYSSFMTRKSNGALHGVVFKGGGRGRGKSLYVQRASLEGWCRQRNFSSGVQDVKPGHVLCGFSRAS